MTDPRTWIDRIRAWLKKPHHSLTGGQRTLRWWFDLARHGVAELRKVRAQQMAAALTYRTLFSLLPTIVLMLAVLQAFVSEAERLEFKRTLVNWVLSPLENADPLLTDPGSASPNAGEDVQEARQEAAENRERFEEVRVSLTERVNDLLAGLETVNFRSISVVGVLLFVYAATGLLSTIEGSFNTVYGAVQGRPVLIRLPLYYTVITLGPVVIIGGQILRRTFLDLLQSGAWTNLPVGTLAVVTPILSAWAVLGLMYMLLPNTRVSFRMAMVGSFVAGVLLVLGSQLFTIYIQKAAFSTLYGALGLLPLFLFWLWVIWLIVLFGLTLSYTLQSMVEGKYRLGFLRSREDLVLEPALALPLATHVAQGFRQGRPVSLAELSRQMSLPEWAVGRLAQTLVSAGLLHQIKEGRTSGYTLAHPAESISAAQVLAAGEAILPENLEPVPSGAWNLLENLKRGIQDEASGTTLADLIGPEPKEA